MYFGLHVEVVHTTRSVSFRNMRSTRSLSPGDIAAVWNPTPRAMHSASTLSSVQKLFSKRIPLLSEVVISTVSGQSFATC